MISICGDYELDDDPERIDPDAVWAFLSTQAYWGTFRSRADFEAQLASAWRVVGVYETATGRQVGFARAISDGVAFAYLADVYIVTPARGAGLGKELVEAMIDRGPGAGFRWTLHTSDAHGLYRKYGFAVPDDTYMERPRRENAPRGHRPGELPLGRATAAGGTMAADSLTVPAPGASPDSSQPRPSGKRRAGLREEARSNVHWGLAHGLPRLAMRAAARRGDLQGRLMVAASSGEQMWDLLAEIRAAGPLHRSRLAYLTTDHAAVKEVLASPDFRAGPRPRGLGLLGWLLDQTTPAVLHPIEPPSLLVTEPPDHTRYRKLVTRVFTVRAVEQLRVRTEAIAHQLLDALDTLGPTAPVDLVESYCALLPVTIISEILGVPPEQQGQVLEMGTRAAPSLDFGLGWRSYRTVYTGLRDFTQWLDAHIEQLRRHPGEDLLSQLIGARDEQGTLSDSELKATAGLVLAAGFETTVNLLGNTIALLGQHPDQLARLRAEPALWPNAVDESLRLDPPVLMTGRICDRTTTIAGITVPANAVVITVLAGANRDPLVFEYPDRFDVARENAREHVSFSGGRHYCLGASLARMEGEVGLRAISERFPGLRLLPGARRRPTRILRGYETLPARLR